MAADYVNPTYVEIMHGDEVKPYESLQKPEIRQGLPAGPVLVGPAPAVHVPAGPVPTASKPQSDASSTQTEVLLKRYKAAVKRYKAAVIILAVLSVLLLLAVILVYLFVGQTCNCQAINKQQSITGSKLEEVTEVLEERFGLWEQYMNDAQYDLVMTLYTDNCILLPHGGPPIEGKTGVKQALMQTIPGIFSSTRFDGITYIELMNDNTAYVNGYYTSFYADGTSTKAKDTILWRKISDEWYLERDMWNEG